MVDFDIDKICRVCLRTNIELTLLFDEQNAVDGVCLSEMITECTMYMVRRHDEFPHLICHDCIERVRGAYNFKKQFEASHRTLISFLDSVNNVLVDTKPSKANDKCIQTDESTLYPCEKCDEKFLDYGRLREHRSVYHKGTANLCRICLKTFSRIGDLKNHIAVCHPEVGHITANECMICSKKFTRKDHVVRHLKSVHKLGPDVEDELKTSSMSIENLVETEIEYENLTNQDGDPTLLLNYDHGDYEDISSDSPEFEATNPFSSDDDEQPLSELRSTKKINKNENLTSQGGDTTSILKYDSGDYEENTSDEQPLAELRNTKTTEQKDLDCKLPAINLKLEDSSNNEMFGVLNSIETNPKNNEKISCESLGESNSEAKRRYKCSECDKVFTRSSHVKRHLSSHRQEKPYPCTVCEKRFSRADHLKNHLTQHDTDKPFQCDVCDRTYGRLDLLKRHKEQKHNGDTLNKCEHCNKSFSSKNYLQKHMRLHTEKKRWNCKWCSLECESKDSLKDHVKTHNKEKPYLCSECGLRFVRNDYLLVHMRRHNGEKPYKCKYCGKGFPRSTDLNVHEKYHTGEKTHLCPTCGKGFQRAYNLVVHMRVHTGERPYQCPHCPKNFAQSNDLKAHIRRHTGERFKCDICGTGFIQAYNVTQHKFVVHGIEVESRIRRLVKFTSNKLNEKVTDEVVNDPDEQIKSEEMPEF